MQRLVEAAVARFGRLDIAVNNAGTDGDCGPLVEQTAESYACDFRHQCAWCVAKHEARAQGDEVQGRGSIVNISSTMGHRGAPNASLYSASKHALEGSTKCAALEAAQFGVRVNAVAPGPVETPMLNRFADNAERKNGLIAGAPMRRVGWPEEIAQAILFMTSDKASFVTGQVIDVNGGKTAR